MTINGTTKLTMIHDPIDDLFKADAQQQSHIDDAGFTLRVMDALPAHPAISPLMRYGLPFGMAVVAALIAAVATPAGNFIIDAAMDIVTQTATPNAMAMVVLLAVMAGVGIASAGTDR